MTPTDNHAGLVERLHLHAELSPNATPESEYLALDAATAIETLTTRLTEAEAEITRLREALEPFAKSVFACPEMPSGWRVGYEPDHDDCCRAHLAFFGKPTALTEGNQPHD